MRADIREVPHGFGDLGRGGAANPTVQPRRQVPEQTTSREVLETYMHKDLHTGAQTHTDTDKDKNTDMDTNSDSDSDKHAQRHTHTPNAKR